MVTKQEVTQDLRAIVRRAEEIAARLGEKDLACPVCENGWSVKQTFAHLASMGAAPSFFIGMAQRASSGGGSGGGGMGPGFDINAFNAQQVELRKDRSMAELLAEFRQGHEAGIALVNSTPDDLLNKQMPDPFQGGESTPLEMIQSGCTGHEGDHLDEVESVLRG
jgi:hypothetical protein